MDFRRRLSGLQAKMEEMGLDLVVYAGSPDFQYLTGANLEWRRGRDLMYPQDNVFVPRKGDPVVTLNPASKPYQSETWIKDVRVMEPGQTYYGIVKKIISDLSANPKRVGVGDYVWGSTSAILTSLANTVPSVTEGLLDSLRMIKEPDELIKLKRAADITDNAMGLVIPRVVDGLTQRNLCIMIEMMGRGLGASDVSFPATGGYLKTGTMPSEDPFIYPREAGLVRGVSIAFDVGFVVDGYCSDWGRSFYFGTPRKDILEAYQALQLSVVKMADDIGRNVHRCNEIFPHIEKTLDQYGFGNYLRARLRSGTVGHQIGVEVHEDPWLRPDSKQELVDGMVFCVEPKLWYKGDYYLRVEDMITIKNGRGEFLTKYPRDQFQLP